MHVHLLNSPVSRGSQCFLIFYLVRGQSLWKLCVITQDEQHRPRKTMLSQTWTRNFYRQHIGSQNL